MPDPLAGATGERMALDAYYADFEQNFWRSADLGFWKLERQQTFREPPGDRLRRHRPVRRPEPV